jgi:hypothetical protein
MRKLEVPGKRLLVLTLGGGVHKDALEVECGCLSGLVGRNLHGEEAIGSTLGRVERRVTATDDNLGHDVSFWMPREYLEFECEEEKTGLTFSGECSTTSK